MRSGQQGQQHAGHHVALMHTVGQREHTRCHSTPPAAAARSCRPGRCATAKVGQARRDQQDIEPPQLLPGDAQQYRLFQALPVAAQRRHPVESVDGGVRVAGHRTCVLFYQLGEQLCDAEKRQPHRQRGQQCQRRTAEAAAKGAGLIFFQRDSCQVAGRQHRPDSSSLRLDSQRNAEPDGRRAGSGAVPAQKASSSRQCECAVDLLPDAGVKSNSSGLTL